MRSEQGANQGQDTNTVEASGKTLAEARICLDKALNKPIFLGAVQALIMTENMADQGIEEYAYRVRQMIDYRKTMDVIVTHDDPGEFLSIVPENASTIGFAIEDTLDNLLELGATFHMSLADLLEKLASKNPCYLMSTLSIVNGQISLVGYTMFSGGYRKGFIPYEESRGIVYISLGLRGGKPKFDYMVSLGDERFTLETELTSIRITPAYKDGAVEFRLNMKFNAMQLYPSDRAPITPEAEAAIRAELSRQLLDDLSQTIQLSLEHDCDYLSFSEPFRIRYPDIYEQIDWESAFKNAVFSIHAEVELRKNESVDYDPAREGGNG
jgi:hypothetical protein